MEALRIPALRYWLAALAVLALAPWGAGRGRAAVADGAPRLIVVGGVPAPICHAGGRPGTRDAPGGPRGSPDCCAACALAAPALRPTAPDTAPPAVAPAVLRVAPRPVRPARPARWRPPRLARGPPNRGT